jgi:serine/threonine protein kinase
VHQPLQPLVTGDKVVVTIWYRAPELLLGAKHYNMAIDCWAVGCVFAEMMGLKPIFKGEEAKIDPKKAMPFQKEQLTKIFEVLGAPTVHDWVNLVTMPDYPQYNELGFQKCVLPYPRFHSLFDLHLAVGTKLWDLGHGGSSTRSTRKRVTIFYEACSNTIPTGVSQHMMRSPTTGSKRTLYRQRSTSSVSPKPTYFL